MQYDIRAELPGEELWDFRVAADAYEAGPGVRTPAFRVARELAGDRIRDRVGQTAQIEWRGMVVFVNRPIPLDRKQRR